MFGLSDEQHILGPIVVKPYDPHVKNAKRVAVFNTGGTIGMKANEQGSLEPCPGYLAERMKTMREFHRPEMPSVSLFEMLPLIDSSDMGPTDWTRIADLLDELYHEYDAFVIIMGTDTMAFAASALSFMLENLGKMVVLTGSMLPLSDLFNDAQRNLIVSLVMAANLNIPEVCIFMNDKLFRGNRTVKSNSGGLDAFESPNFPSLAQLETGIRFKSNSILSHPKGRFRVHHDMMNNIAVWRMIPGFDDEYILTSIEHASNLRGVVLELYGTGNLSSRKASLIDALQRAINKGIVIVAVSQCLRGRVELSAYALGRRLETIGVISGLDMTTEAVVTKLAYLMSWPNMKPETLRSYMSKSLRGELSESSGSSGLNTLGVVNADTGDVFISMTSLSSNVAASRSGVTINGYTRAPPADETVLDRLFSESVSRKDLLSGAEFMSPNTYMAQADLHSHARGLNNSAVDATSSPGENNREQQFLNSSGFSVTSETSESLNNSQMHTPTTPQNSQNNWAKVRALVRQDNNHRLAHVQVYENIPVFKTTRTSSSVQSTASGSSNLDSAHSSSTPRVSAPAPAPAPAPASAPEASPVSAASAVAAASHALNNSSSTISVPAMSSINSIMFSSPLKTTPYLSAKNGNVNNPPTPPVDTATAGSHVDE